MQRDSYPDNTLQIMQILIFGASNTYGVGDIEGGWSGKLRKFIEANSMDRSYIYNLGIPGNTSEDLLRRFESETKERIREGHETVIMFSVGSNDAQFQHAKNATKIPIEKYKNNLEKLFKLARKHTSKVYFVGIPPVDDLRSDPWKPGKSYKLETVRNYNEAAKQVCGKSRVPFVEILSQFEKNNYKKLLSDGIHANSRGHELIFKLVKNYLLKEKII